MVSDDTLQLTFKKLPPFESWHSGRVSKIIHNYLKRLLHICVKLDFLHILHPKQHGIIDWMQQQKWESSCLLLSQTIKRFAKIKNNAYLLTKFFGKGIFIKICYFSLTFKYHASLRAFYPSLLLWVSSNIYTSNSHYIVSQLLAYWFILILCDCFMSTFEKTVSRDCILSIQLLWAR